MNRLPVDLGDENMGNKYIREFDGKCIISSTYKSCSKDFSTDKPPS